MKIAMWGNDSGSKYWRLIDPAKYLRQAGLDAQIMEGPITEDIAKEADVYVLQSCVDKDGIALLHAYQQEFGKKLVVDVDDFMQINEDSPFHMEHAMTDAYEVMKATISVADMVTTTTQTLASKLRELNNNVKVLPNSMDFDRWDHPKLKNTSNRIRIGWAGSITHMNDLKMIVEPLKRICDEFPQVELVFVGEQRIEKEFKGYPVNIVLGVPFEAWPDRLHGLRLDIGLAPLEDNEFNRCKSNIKWQEYSIAKIAGVYSPTVYQHNGFEPKFGLVAYDSDHWYRAIKTLIVNTQLRHEIAENAHRKAQISFNLKRNITKWLQAYRSLT